MKARANRRKPLPNGRSATAKPFVMLPHFVYDSAAYRSLKPGPRALLWELIRRHNGSNNGQIGFGVRAACEAINIADKDTISRYFAELEVKGLIRAVRLGGFNMKDPTARRATEWALTWERISTASATKDFLEWGKPKKSGPENPSLQSGLSGQ